MKSLATTAAALLLAASHLGAADTGPPISSQSPATNLPGGTARAQARGGQALTLDALFELLDTNRDGKISKDEATGVYTQRFAEWDADGDGFATRQEIHDYRLRLGIDDNGQRIAGAAPAGNNRGQRRADATVLKEPADWRLETMPVPPGFAPDIKLNGSEEIRFAPGMFDTASGNYFTCVIAITADGAPELGAAEIKDFLEKYYRGLSTGRAQRTGVKADANQMNATVAPSSGAAAKNRFDAQIDFHDSFSDGRKITLNVEAQTFPLAAQKQTCMLLLVSPSAKDSAAWKTLRDIGKKTAASLPSVRADLEAMKSLESPASETSATEMKWHPGHYAFVQFGKLDESHLYENFRGIQKTYAWHTLEPEMGRYDFSAIRADLEFLGKHGKRLVVQVQTKTFGAGQNYCPDYLAGPDYGGGVYRTRWGSFNPIIWNEAVNRRLNTLYTQLGKALDREPFLEAVVIPESATTFENADREKLQYTADRYTRSVEAGMQAARDAFPTTVVIQYANMPPESIQSLADYAKAHDVGFGGPDIYPYDPVLTNPQRGVYRLYAPLSGSVPLGAAVQQNDYTQRTAFRGGGGETPVREIYEFGRDKLRLNYIFWGTRTGYFEKVQAMLAEPVFPKDPAGGLDATRPKSLEEISGRQGAAADSERDDSGRERRSRSALCLHNANRSCR